jgi:hypothetical protein
MNAWPKLSKAAHGKQMVFIKRFIQPDGNIHIRFNEIGLVRC